MLEKQEKEQELESVLEQAELLVQQNQFEQANVFYYKAMEFYNESGNEPAKADLLYNIGLNMSNYGNIQEAIKVWEQSVHLLNTLEDTANKASAFHNIANMMAKYGNIANAEQLWQQSLVLMEKADDTPGMAATLISLAWLANQQGDGPEEHKYNLQAARLLAKSQAWTNLILVLINLEKSAATSTGMYLAQALWLSLYSEIDADTIFFATSDLLKIIGLEHEAAPAIASTGIVLTSLRGSEHPKKKEIQQACTEMLAACVLVRNVPQEEISNWLAVQGLNDNDLLYSEFDQAMNKIVGEGNWLFDKESFVGWNTFL
jgi:tetratricopeptide (TPR) repeat protein